MRKIIKYLIVLLITLLIPITSISAKTIGDIQKEIDAAQKKLNDTNTQKALNSQNLAETQKKIAEIKQSITKILLKKRKKVNSFKKIYRKKMKK